MDTKQFPANLASGNLFFFFFLGGGGGVNCLVVFPTHFNPDNSLLIFLQISLLFMCINALNFDTVAKSKSPAIVT